jgi:hypothetical protein
MAYNVFISYSTKDLHIANHVRAALSIPGVNVFIAEYSVPASAPLNAFIEMGLRSCDLFALLWSRNSKASDYVPQEIGIARGRNKTILPIVLEEGLALPGFLAELKYLPAYKDYGQALLWLQQFVQQNAGQQQQGTALLVLLSLFGVVALMSSNRE